MKARKIESTPEAWEAGRLGRDAAHAQAAPEEVQALVDESLGLQMISIRLQKELIDDYKKIAEFRGVGYQPLMREALKRFVDAECQDSSIDNTASLRGHTNPYVQSSIERARSAKRGRV
jgi:uncharacterized protein (DUF4415 family)